MNKQEIFDKVARHLLIQGGRAMRTVQDVGQYAPVDVCAYRGDDGTMCAAGCLIPDGLYHSDMEDRPCMDPEVADALLTIMDRECLMFVRRLQGVHDSILPDFWLEQLARVAFDHELDSSVLKEATLPKPGEGDK